MDTSLGLKHSTWKICNHIGVDAPLSFICGRLANAEKAVRTVSVIRWMPIRYVTDASWFLVYLNIVLFHFAWGRLFEEDIFFFADSECPRTSKWRSQTEHHTKQRKPHALNAEGLIQKRAFLRLPSGAIQTIVPLLWASKRTGVVAGRDSNSQRLFLCYTQ